MIYMYVVSRMVNGMLYPCWVFNTRESADIFIKNNYSDNDCVIDEVDLITEA